LKKSSTRRDGQRIEDDPSRAQLVLVVAPEVCGRPGRQEEELKTRRQGEEDE